MGEKRGQEASDGGTGGEGSSVEMIPVSSKRSRKETWEYVDVDVDWHGMGWDGME